MEEPTIEEPIMEESTVTIKEHLDDCSICLEKIVNEEHKKITTCNHIFHEECMARWMSLNHSCPLCRKHFDYEVDGYNDENYDDNINPVNNNSNINNILTGSDYVRVFAVNYNVLRTMSGMAGLSYSS